MKVTKDLSCQVPLPFIGEFVARLNYLSPAIEQLVLDTANRQTVEFVIDDGSEELVPMIHRGIESVLESILSKNREFQPRVLGKRESSVPPSPTSPMEELVRRGEIHSFGPGRVGLGPMLVGLENRIDRDLLAVAKKLDAAQYRFPTVIGADVLHQCRYLQSFPQFVTLASHLSEDMENLNRFSREVSIGKHGLTVPDDSLAPPTTVLSPTVCFHVYSWLKDMELEAPRCVTALGHCHRYESKTMSGLERLWDFHMREIVFAGDGESAEQWWAACVDLCVSLLDSWNITYEIVSATDPFFVEGYSSVASYQAAFELKYEIRVPLPYSNGRTMAIGSINRHHDFFGKAMGFSQKGAPGNAHTACVGFGMERVVWAWLCTHGLNPDRWPS